MALRVLSQLTRRFDPSRREVIILRRNAPPGDADLPVDELCCQLICESKVDEPVSKGTMSEARITAA